MSYDIATINYVIDDHEVVKENIERVGSSINDLQAVSSLQETLGSVDVLTGKRKDLQEAMNLLAEGLQKHFTYEEKMLLPLFGRALMQALAFEHQEIRTAIEEVKLLVFSSWPESQEELYSRRGSIQQATNRLCQMIEGHADREDTILKMVKRSLEGGNPNQDS